MMSLRQARISQITVYQLEISESLPALSSRRFTKKGISDAAVLDPVGTDHRWCTSENLGTEVSTYK